MGLGPPVCQHCKVIGELLDKPVPLIKAKGSGSMMKHTNWICPICGETDLLEHAGFDNFDKYKENERVLRFFLNKKEKLK